MPLSAVNFVVKGPVKSADMLQFVNLFTGVMADQPVTFANTLSVGGSQGNTTVPLRLFGAPGQTTHLIDLYADHTQAQPGFGFSATGAFAWGPGGVAPQDTFLSRIATQAGHATDTAGLYVTPMLEVGGNVVMHGSLVFPGGGAVGDGGANIVNIAPNLAVQTNLYVGLDHQQWLHEGVGFTSAIALEKYLLINGANTNSTGLGLSAAHLQVRSDDMPDVVNTMINMFSAQTFAANWLQFNVHAYKQTAGVGWPGDALLLDYDVDNANAAGGRIVMQNGKVAIGGFPTDTTATGGILQVQGNTTLYGNALVTGTTTFNSTVFVNVPVSGATPPVPNSGAAAMAFQSNIGPKISLYDLTGGVFAGFGINTGEVYYSIPPQFAPPRFRLGSPGAAAYTMLGGVANATDWLVDFGQNFLQVPNGGAGSQPIGFHHAFTAPPTVICGLAGFSGAISNGLSKMGAPNVHSVGTNGFMFDVDNQTGGQQSITIVWVAIGH